MGNNSTLVQKMQGHRPVAGNDVTKKNGTVKARRRGQVYAVTESRCKVCREPQVRKIVDMLAASGYKMSEISRHVDAAHNAYVDSPSDRIAYASINRHIMRHLSVEDAAIKEILERRALEKEINLEEGVRNIVTPASFAETVVVKAQEKLVDGKLEITARDGLEAARTLTEFENAAASKVSVSEAFAQVEKIMAAVKAVCSPEQISQVVSVLRGERSVMEISQLPQLTEELVEAEVVEETLDQEPLDMESLVLADPKLDFDLSGVDLSDIDLSDVEN